MADTGRLLYQIRNMTVLIILVYVFLGLAWLLYLALAIDTAKWAKKQSKK